MEQSELLLKPSFILLKISNVHFNHLFTMWLQILSTLIYMFWQNTENSVCFSESLLFALKFIQTKSKEILLKMNITYYSKSLLMNFCTIQQLIILMDFLMIIFFSSYQTGMCVVENIGKHRKTNSCNFPLHNVKSLGINFPQVWSVHFFNIIIWYYFIVIYFLLPR